MSNTVKCNVCDFPNVPMKAGGSGAMSGSCPECKTQIFARTPKAVAALQARMSGQPAPAAAAKKSGAGIDFLEDC